MDLAAATALAASGLRAQAGRLRVAAQNLANADSTARTPGGAPYRRLLPALAHSRDPASGADLVALGRAVPDRAPFPTRHDPGHPAADATGMVLLPNVDPLIEMQDLRAASRAYEANLGVMTATRRMISRTLDILKA